VESTVPARSRPATGETWEGKERDRRKGVGVFYCEMGCKSWLEMDQKRGNVGGERIRDFRGTQRGHGGGGRW